MGKTLNVRKIVNYWKATAKHDYETMLGLFKIKRYSDALFYGHIVLEKILKAHVVYETKKEAPRIHDLVRLQELARVKMSKEQIDLLNEINDFNIRSRYPEYRLRFYKQCTEEYAENYLKKIKKLYQELCQRKQLKK